MAKNDYKTRLLLGCVACLGVAALFEAIRTLHPDNIVRFVCFFLVAVLSSGMKVSLPGIDGTMSVSFLFALIGVSELTLPETLLMISAATVVQCSWRVKSRPKTIQLLFNVGDITIAACLCDRVYRSEWLTHFGAGYPLRLVFAAVAFFFINTYPVAAVIASTQNKGLRQVWSSSYFWSFPYYLVGAAVACVFHAAGQVLGWELTFLALPVVFLIYRSYRLYLGRLEDEKRHAEEQKRHAEDIASLHLRTIEALALAIEAKDHTTHDHLERVQVYAVEIGKELGLSDVELDALRAAALLHDIGKLAVPEHIISKPGRLTPEEFEKMKIHPTVGAEILEQVQFPYPVAPIVRAHHEKWNGTGYPAGLKGEEIPIGARILSAVDCLDAVASDRQYRRALPLDEAMDVVRKESGVAYDPKVIEILGRRYRELEQMAKGQQIEKAKLSTDLKIERCDAPAAGFESSDSKTGVLPPGDFLQSIAAARQEVQALFEMYQDLGKSLSLNETLSVLAVKLKRIIPHDSIAIYIQRDKKLIPEFVSGDDFRLFSSLEIPVGQGLSGWVAENRKAIVNGNPSVEPGYMNDPDKFSTLRSALAVPLEGLNGILGVLTLYHGEKDAFSRDHLRILMALSSKLSLSVENALKYQQAESSATTDYLTGLPNARSLFLHLDSELARCKRTGGGLAVLVCDLNGFKPVNDRFGHLEGNRVLQVIARRFREICREYDYVARMGGDEFVLILPGFEQEALQSKVDQLSRISTEAGLEVCGERILSVSVGAAFFNQDGMDAEQLLTEADRRMYKQKHEYKEELRARRAGEELDRLSLGVQVM
jgi:diguanylate cyclase (GGDEF)-like protein/putative nucleotidyltransferase with HDIG domain